MHTRIFLEHHHLGGGRRVKTRLKQAQKTKGGAKEAEGRSQKGGQKSEKSFQEKERRETNTVWRRGTYKKDMGEMIGGVRPSEGSPWSTRKQALDPPTHPKKVAVRLGGARK